jgi:ribonuclease VapC
LIVDTSALVAIVFEEPGCDELISKLAAAPRAGIGTPSLAELGLVLAARLDADPEFLIRRLLEEFSIVEVPFGPDHWRSAIEAFMLYGRGRHPARLNYGDCMTYAVAHLAREPLLFVGTDFSATDLERA